MILASCISSKKNKKNKELIEAYLPELLRDLEFGMSPAEATAVRPQLAPLNYVNDNFGFRKEYIEDINDPSIERILLYFDAEGNQPLYEIIITYKSTAARDVDAKLLFEEPNFQGEEWRYQDQNKTEIRAWKFDQKLVIVGVLPGTEWSEQTME